MKRGLVLGKFYPLHNGHIGLINFAVQQCDELIVLVCASPTEDITGETRLQWLTESFVDNAGIKPVLLNYDEALLPNTSVSSKKVSRLWASKIVSALPSIDIVFSSEDYGVYLAGYINARHVFYDRDRSIQSISASEIRCNPTKHWGFIARAAQPYFVKRICLLGTESTGKSILTERLAEHYLADFVPEMAREILEHTEECTEEHLQQIALLHASTIKQKIKTARRLLFVDTDLTITSSYSRYLFNKTLIVPNWIKEINRFDLYLYLDNDAPHVQDGTRLDKLRRDELDASHKLILKENNVDFKLIHGDWDQRFAEAVRLVDAFLNFT